MEYSEKKKQSITIHRELHRKNFLIFFKSEKKPYECSLIKLRKSFETVSNNLIFSFSIAGRLNLSSNGRFKPSRNLKTKAFNDFLNFILIYTLFNDTISCMWINTFKW